MAHTIKEVLQNYANDLDDMLSDDGAKDPAVKALNEISRLLEEAKPHSNMGWNTERQRGYDDASRDYSKNLERIKG